MTKLFPIIVKIEVLLIRDADQTIAKVGLTEKRFRPASDERLAELIEIATAKANAHSPGFRPMTHAEVWDHVFEEETGSGMRFATPELKEGEEWWRVETDEVLAKRYTEQFDDEEEID